jgi:KDO2-lipid IV(A) lauroyltransferase
LEKDIASNYLFLAKLIRQVVVKPSRKLLEKRLSMTSKPEIDQWLTAGKSVIVTMGHIGNWEWNCSFLGLHYPHQICTLYKKIKSPWLNAWMYKRRQQHGQHLVEIRQMRQLVNMITTKPMLVLIGADQNPGSDQGVIWVPFLERNTAFVNGPEHLALRYGLPVAYMQVTPRRDGGYTLEIETLYNGIEKVTPGDITRRYAARLEKNIHAHRSHWLWSHRRWKRSMPS